MGGFAMRCAKSDGISRQAMFRRVQGDPDIAANSQKFTGRAEVSTHGIRFAPASNADEMIVRDPREWRADNANICQVPERADRG
jgi:hypothetical protein